MVLILEKASQPWIMAEGKPQIVLGCEKGIHSGIPGPGLAPERDRSRDLPQQVIAISQRIFHRIQQLLQVIAD